MQILAILWPAVSFFLRVVVVKFFALTGIFAIMAVVVPAAISLIAPKIGTGGLSSSFSGLSAGIWWVLDAFSLGYGLPLIISAFIARFLIRRLPIIG